MTSETFQNFVDHRLDADLGREARSNSAVICAASSGNEVVFVSEEFTAHTGYRAEEAIGRNVSFLQGPNTEVDAVQRFRELIRTGTPGMVRITNYRKDGSAFLHEVEMRPIHDSSGTLTHFVAIQRPR